MPASEMEQPSDTLTLASQESTHQQIVASSSTSDAKDDPCALSHVDAEPNDPETATNDEDDTDKNTPLSLSPVADNSSSRKRARDCDTDTSPVDDSEEFTKKFSHAQLQAKVKRARLEANIAVQEQLTALQFTLLKAQQDAEAQAREKEQVESRYSTLKESMQQIVAQHQRTLNGMRDTIKLENLVASLDKEKASKNALRESFQKQNAELLAAQKRIESLSLQITKYQKTETALAQSISHFQHQFSSKDQERSASIERVKLSLEQDHQETRVALEKEVERLTILKEAQQIQLTELQVEHGALHEKVHEMATVQEQTQAETRDWQARVAQLETEKAVLVSKVEQVHKADASLRSTINTLEARLLEKEQEIETQKREIDELTKIASDLMDMAESQQAEKQELLQVKDTEANERLARTRTRLRESLG